MSCQDQPPVKDNNPELYLWISSFQSEVSVEWWCVDFIFPRTGTKWKKFWIPQFQLSMQGLLLHPQGLHSRGKMLTIANSFPGILSCQVYLRQKMFHQKWHHLTSHREVSSSALQTDIRAQGNIGYLNNICSRGWLWGFNHSEWKDPQLFGHIIPFLVTNILGCSNAWPPKQVFPWAE